MSLSFYATALEAFGPGLDRLVTCLKDRNYDIVDDLAAARYAMRVNVGSRTSCSSSTACGTG